ncbi:MAG: aminomethyl transferase family protein [Peptococcaceae bacterium]|nr:aminomethyl transferase family protein [Peptococcaceae bacterium]
MQFGADSGIWKGAFTVNIGMSWGSSSYYPYEFTGAADELLAARKTAWIGVNLNVSPVYDITGPEAVKFLNYVCVNRDYAKLKVGGSRHAIMCNDKGLMLADGVILKADENRFRTYWMAPVIDYYVKSLGYDVQGVYIPDEYFFQIDGPKSLEILEKATQTDLHDLKFGQNKKVKIEGTDMIVYRLGMSGALAYEVHGAAKDAEIAYAAIRKTGEEFGAKMLGTKNYCVNHTQAGYPNQHIHYQYPYFSSGEGLANFPGMEQMRHTYVGSCADNEENYFVTPFDVGWGYLINFDHDFIGKEALQKLAENPPRVPVTLEWDADDVADIYASQFRGQGTQPYERIDSPMDWGEPWHVLLGPNPLRNDKVLVDGKFIGVSAGRINDYYHQRVISLGFIDKEYAMKGNDVIIIWGTPGKPQKEVRAKIARFPYYDGEYRNETFDVEKIPHPKF